MYSLFIDTHSNKTIIIVFKNKEILKKKEVITNYNQSNITMPTIVEIINELALKIKDINQIIVVNGPGSFTGVRIGVTIAKTLAFTLNIPIKVVSSLLIKALSFEHETINIVEKEKNGAFIGLFDKNNKLINPYYYLSTQEYEKIEDKEKYMDRVEMNYNKIVEYVETIEPTIPHAVNPLYIKMIGVQK